MLRRHWTFLLALLPLLGWWTYGLFDLDEGYYAAIAGEMNRRGEWVTPIYNGHPWFEKPILVYWLMKPSLMLFGDMVGPRVPSVVTTALLYVLGAWFARRRLSDEAARWTPIVLGSSLLVVGAGRMVLTDPPFVLALTAAFMLFWESLVDDRRWRIASAACLGVAVLGKGPVAGLLFIPVAGWTYWKQPELRPAFRGGWLAGTAVFALVVASWYGPCYRANGHEFVQKFLIEQNLGRFEGGDKAHAVPLLPFGWAFYPGLLLVGFAPWWWFLRRAWERMVPVERYLKSWAAVVLIFFTISSAKLPHYILPALPPLGLLVAGCLRPIEAFTRKVFCGMIAAAIVANAVFLGYYYGFNFGTYHVWRWTISLRAAGFHAEVHRLACYVRSRATPDEDVALYALPKEKGYPKGLGMHVEETDHPSLLLYLDRDVLDLKPSDWSKLLADPKPVWIITRWNRVTPELQAQAGSRLKAVDPFPPELYRLYRMEPVAP